MKRSAAFNRGFRKAYARGEVVSKAEFAAWRARRKQQKVQARATAKTGGA